MYLTTIHYMWWCCQHLTTILHTQKLTSSHPTPELQNHSKWTRCISWSTWPHTTDHAQNSLPRRHHMSILIKPTPIRQLNWNGFIKDKAMSDEKNQAMTQRYNGTYMNWVGVLLYIVDKTGWNISYLAMSLSGHTNYQSTVCHNILCQSMCYL